MVTISKKHHYVPQAQLRHFSKDRKHNHLYVFDKHTDKSFGSSIKNVGSENHFNTLMFDDSKWNFEDLFQRVDTRSAKIIAQILEHKSLAWMSSEDREALADFVTVQLLRTHFTRTEPKAIASALREMMTQTGYNPEDDPTMAMPSDNLFRMGAVTSFLQRDDSRNLLLKLTPALYSNETKVPFIISDHPVIRSNAFPYGDHGLASPGILVYVPISPIFTVIMHCPTIIARYEAIDKMDLEPAKMARERAYRDGLRSGEPILVDEAKVSYLNESQIAESTQYVYSSIDEFDQARQLLKLRPELRHIDVHFEIGELGMAPDKRPRMPKGWQLVITGTADHCMIAIDEIDKQGEGITAKTSDISLIKKVASDSGEIIAGLFIDGQQRRHMGKAMIEIIDENDAIWFRVVHRDPSLRDLDKVIHKRPK